jgi:lipopolysaccharide transport system permease protein
MTNNAPSLTSSGYPQSRDEKSSRDTVDMKISAHDAVGEVLPSERDKLSVMTPNTSRNEDASNPEQTSPGPNPPIVTKNFEAKPMGLSGAFGTSSSRVLLIEAGATERQYWRDIWRYRELFYFLTWRDLLVRYKQTVVGVSWSLIRPLLTMIVLTVVFGKLGKMPSGGVPYPLLVSCGMLPWQFFSTAMTESGNSLISNSNLISKVYFPRLVIVISSVITSFVDSLISGAFLVVLMIWYRYPPPAVVFFLPLFVLLAFGASLGVGLWIAALMVEYRDFRFIVPFVVQFGLYISPVGFRTSVVPGPFRILYALNPMVGVIDGIRWCVLGGGQSVSWSELAIALADVIVLLASGLWYFRRTERTFADVI